ncbi:trehalose utilization [Pseudalgibacter alginicilyticus]|uniref:Trehalose utilization n=1 Tax=Pseudalgibacter alginicilyticus TaxID=1736674 RepID=A0A0N7HYU7_9FLAO|nr:ThuA domain-containing protein [Pseudalgibacter alginicilyticus]ALJ06246.1 trehalose utilization [Pseudalgibacter alginicilyticus]
MTNLKKFNFLIIIILTFSFSIHAQHSHKKLRALIMDGENNHGIWPKSTMMMKDYLEETNLFEVDIVRKAFTWQGEEYLEKYPLATGEKTTPVKQPKFDPNFNPKFKKYDVVISNLGWKASDLPDNTKKSFEKYMANGGGLVVVHAADNSWGDWDEFNKMIGIGGWGGRNTESGPYVYYDNDGNLKYDTSEGKCGSHGPQREFLVDTRAPNHPIMKGLPMSWLHAKDELYEKLRGPAENLTVLATAYSKVEKSSEGTHQPMLMAINYKKGRVFHTTLGHTDYSIECVGFITTFNRGAEWAATGNVTQPIPIDFPTKTASSSRKWTK